MNTLPFLSRQISPHGDAVYFVIFGYPDTGACRAAARVSVNIRAHSTALARTRVVRLL